MILEKKEPERLVPHRGRAVLLSRIIRHDRESLTAEYDVTQESVFYDRTLRGIPSWACFECMAQGIAAFAALSGHKDPGRPGCVLAVSALTITTPVLPLGEAVTIPVKEEARDEQVSSFQGSLFLAGELVAQAKLTVMELRTDGV